MRFVPLVDARQDPGPWLPFRDLELAWRGGSGAAWARAVQGGLAVHAVHLDAPKDSESLVREVLAVLGSGLGADFIVVPAQPPATRWGVAGFLGNLESLLQATAGRGVKIALRPAAGATPRILDLLREANGDTLGFCWDAALGEPVEPLADRLYCAVGGPDTDPRPLQRWGYRWNLAVPGDDPAVLAPSLERTRAAFPPVLFPTDLPCTALGRPVVPDPEVSLGRIWDRQEPR